MDSMADEQLDLEGGSRIVFPDRPIAGTIDAEQPYSLSPRAKKPSQNPLVRIFGPGPEGTTCRDCVHLWRHGGHAGRYLKCDLRSFTHGPGSDHRAGWRACAMYEASPAE